MEVRVTERVHEIVAHREVIEQAKGMLMFMHGIDADQAFDLLRWRSQETNTKLHALAERLVADLSGLGQDRRPNKAEFDQIFMTAHERVLDAGDDELTRRRTRRDAGR